MPTISIAQLIPLLVSASIFLLVLALGLRTEKGDAVYLLDRPLLLVRSIIAMNVVMVAVAACIAALFDLPRVVEVSLLAIAISPVPPILPGKQARAGGSISYAISLLMAASIAAIVLAPLSVGIVGHLFGQQVAVSTGRIARIVAISIVLPIALGIAIRIYLPRMAERLATPIARAGTVLLVLAVLPVLFTATEQLWALVGNGVLIVLAAFTLIGLALGHAMGGPLPQHRTVLALATSTRHPGVAIAIAAATFPNEKAALAVVLYHLVIGTLVSIPYVKWRQRDIMQPRRSAS